METTIWVLSVILCLVLFIIINRACKETVYLCCMVIHKSSIGEIHKLGTIYYLHVLRKASGDDEVLKLRVTELAYNKFEVGDYTTIIK